MIRINLKFFDRSIKKYLFPFRRNCDKKTQDYFSKYVQAEKRKMRMSDFHC